MSTFCTSAGFSLAKASRTLSTPQVLASALAVEQLRAALDLGCRHQGIEPCPGVDVAALEREAAVRMLQQHELDVLLGELRLCEGAYQEDVRIGAAGDGDALALEVLDFRDRRFLAR